ncbi:Chloride channel protein CLC-e [Arabidopsis thaliana]
MAATLPLCAALRSPVSSRRFAPIHKTDVPFQFNVVLSPFFGSVAIGGRIFPRLPAAKQETDQDEVGFDQQPSQELAIASACLVGVLTGVSVVLFNNCVHLLRDFSWDGIPDRGASWLREAPIGSNWLRVILVPTIGGLVVSILNQLRESAGKSTGDSDSSLDRVKAVLRPFLKTVAACVTLGTGNSLGPEGPSVEIGASIAKGVNSLFNKSPQTGFSLLAAGSAAGISSGFNAAVAGCFFAVESVLWPSSSTDSSTSLPNTTSMVILSAVTASVVSEIGLGSEPAFKVPDYDFRSPGELPLYLLLGALCGLVSLALSRCTSSMTSAVDSLNKDAGIPKAVFPVMGGLSVGIIALVYPEVLYWGFQNVDILLEKRPFVKGLSADLLLQLVAVKIAATAWCRASGLVGGYYAPSLFIGGAAGMAYGKFIGLALAQNPDFNLSILEVASPQAYGLVGMAATLAGVCQVPLTAVLLLFELTQDYRIVLPLLGAVGMSSWITSGQSKRQETRETKETRKRKSQEAVQSLTSSDDESSTNNLCEVESSLCLDDSLNQSEELPKSIFVSEAMRTRFATVMMSTSLEEALTRMLIEKQSCALIVDPDNIFLGILTLSDIQEFSKARKEGNNRPKDIFVNDICSRSGGKCKVPWTVTPDMDLLAAQTIMNKHELSHVAVVSGSIDAPRIHPVGVLDRECITLTRRFPTLDVVEVKLVKKNYLQLFVCSSEERSESQRL